MRGSPLLWLSTLAVLALDQISKLYVLRVLELPAHGRLEVLPPWVNLRMAWNQGVNFGLFSGSAAVLRWGLVALALGIALWVLWWAGRGGAGRARPRRVQLAAGLLAGGALGNALDRVLHGAVADFLNLSCCGIANPFAFNLADVAIFAGALGLILWAEGAKQAGDGGGGIG